MLPVAVASSASDENAMGDVIPVLYVTSCFHIRHAVYGDYGCQSAGGGTQRQAEFQRLSFTLSCVASR